MVTIIDGANKVGKTTLLKKHKGRYIQYTPPFVKYGEQSRRANKIPFWNKAQQMSVFRARVFLWNYYIECFRQSDDSVQIDRSILADIVYPLMNSIKPESGNRLICHEKLLFHKLDSYLEVLDNDNTIEKTIKGGVKFIILDSQRLRHNILTPYQRTEQHLYKRLAWVCRLPLKSTKFLPTDQNLAVRKI